MGAAADSHRTPAAPPVRILEGQAGSEAATDAMRAYFEELEQRLDTTIDPGLTEAVDPEEVTPPHGDFMLVTEVASQNVAGFGAVRVLEPGTVEIARMWLRPDVRGRGLGRFLLTSLENRARGLGGEHVLLAVNDELAEACGLYETAGYRSIDRFVDTPYATRFFGKELRG